MPKGLEGFVDSQTGLVESVRNLLWLVAEAKSIMTAEEQAEFKSKSLRNLNAIVSTAKGLM